MSFTVNCLEEEESIYQINHLYLLDSTPVIETRHEKKPDEALSSVNEIVQQEIVNEPFAK